jgi:hypothetical protein
MGLVSGREWRRPRDFPCKQFLYQFNEDSVARDFLLRELLAQSLNFLVTKVTLLGGFRCHGLVLCG